MKLYISLLGILLFSCQQKPIESTVPERCTTEPCSENLEGIANPENGDLPEEGGEDPTQEASEDTLIEKKWSLAEIDNELIVTDAIVGMLDLIGSRVPVLSVESTKGTSYLQIVRCLSSARIQDISTGVLLRDIDQVSTKKKRLESYLEFDYFGAAEQHPDCILMSFEHMSDVFPDFSAPTGQYVYLIRSCVASSLITREPGEYLRNCSRYVERSTSYDYVNDRQDREQEALLNAQKKRLALRGHAIRIDGIVRQMQVALEACQKRQQEQIKAVKKKQAIARIIGTSINTVANAFVITKSLGSVASTGSKKILQASTKFGKAKAIGSAGGNLLGAGMLLGGLFDGPLPQAFVSLTAHATDIPRTCYDWERSQRDVRKATAQYSKAMETWLLSEERWLDMSRARFLEEGFDPESLPDWGRIIDEYQRWKKSLTPPVAEEGEENSEGEGAAEGVEPIDNEVEAL